MKMKSKRKSGFTLLETVISMAITMILLIGVYNAYVMLIRNTKDAEIKQETSLAGKKITEEIKESAGNVIDKAGVDYFTEDIPMNGVVKIKKDGTITDGDDYVYEADISTELKKTDKSEEIKITSYESSGNNIFVIGNDEIINKSEEHLNESEVFSNSKTVKIIIDKLESGNVSGSIGFQGDDVLTINSMDITIDLKHCGNSQKLKIEVTNNTKKVLKICLLNTSIISGNERNVEIESKKGSVNSYFRAEGNVKKGTLYNVDIKVSGNDSRGLRRDLFESSFVQNMNID